MPVESKPLFRPDVLRPRLQAFRLPDRVVAKREKLARWGEMLASGRADDFKERELLPDFLADVFCDALGYSRLVDDEARHTFSREKHVEVDGKFADAVLGDFRPGAERFVVAIEGKGPRDPLDRPFAGRRMSAVDQAYRYAINLPCDWLIVTSMKEIRLHHKGSDQYTFERFDTRDLARDDAQLKRFVYLLGADRVVPEKGACHFDDLLKVSEAVGKELTREYYLGYAEIREKAFHLLAGANPSADRHAILAATQKLLDRVLFCAFCEDRAPIGWWFAWRKAQHGKDEALRYFTTFLETYPIPRPTEVQRTANESSVNRLIEISATQQGHVATILDWLRVEHEIDKPSMKLLSPLELDSDGFLGEVRKVRGKKKPLSVVGVRSLREEHARTIAPARALAEEARGLERRIGDLVNEAYGLTPAEVRLMWETAPPRMPIGPP